MGLCLGALPPVQAGIRCPRCLVERFPGCADSCLLVSDTLVRRLCGCSWPPRGPRGLLPAAPGPGVPPALSTEAGEGRGGEVSDYPEESASEPFCFVTAFSSGSLCCRPLVRKEAVSEGWRNLDPAGAAPGDVTRSSWCVPTLLCPRVRLQLMVWRSCGLTVTPSNVHWTPNSQCDRIWR